MNELKWETDKSKIRHSMNIVAEFTDKTISSGHIVYCTETNCLWMQSDFDDDYTGYRPIEDIVRWAEYQKVTTNG
jgi:hypothetical protein